MDRVKKDYNRHRVDYCCALIPFYPLHYISFLPTADVVEAEVLDTEALLHLVETPQPLTLHRPSLALPALATPEIPQRSKTHRGKKWTRMIDNPHKSSSNFPPPLVFFLLYSDSPSLQHTPATVGVFSRQTGLTVQVISTFCHWTLLYLKMTDK